MSFSVSTSVFEGPFDLLLHLITREEVDIYAVTLSDIVDAYLAALCSSRQLNGVYSFDQTLRKLGVELLPIE